MAFLRRVERHERVLRDPDGRAVQVEPIKSKLKPPGIERLKLKHDNLLSRFAFKFDFRRYRMVSGWGHYRWRQ